MRIAHKHPPMKSRARGRLIVILLGVAGILGQGRAVRAQCSTVPESGVWYNHQGDDPYKIEVDQPACNDTGGPSSSVWHIRVWSRQLNGSLYERGRYAASVKTLHDRTTWIVVTAYIVGAYMQHLWLQRSAGRDNLRVWIWDESLDVKPSGKKYNAFARTPPPPPIKSIGRVSVERLVDGPPRSMCDAARDARARNSPAAPNLEAQCRAIQMRSHP